MRDPWTTNVEWNDLDNVCERLRFDLPLVAFVVVVVGVM